MFGESERRGGGVGWCTSPPTFALDYSNERERLSRAPVGMEERWEEKLSFVKLFQGQFFVRKFTFCVGGRIRSWTECNVIRAEPSQFSIFSRLVMSCLVRLLLLCIFFVRSSVSKVDQSLAKSRGCRIFNFYIQTQHVSSARATIIWRTRGRRRRPDWVLLCVQTF